MEEFNLCELENMIRKAISSQLSSYGERALTSFLALPGIDKWRPVDNLVFNSRSVIFEVGLVFSLLGDNDSVASHKKKIVKGILATQENQFMNRSNLIPNSQWSEIKIGALLSYLSEKVSFIKENIQKTPDIKLEINGKPVYVEVARADIRFIEQQVQDSLKQFVDALKPGDFPFNLICYFDDASNMDHLSEAFDAAISLVPGQLIEASNKRWIVRAIHLEDQENIINKKHEFKPEWWPGNRPIFVINKILLGGTNPAGSIHVESLIATASYMNPIRRKAESGQGKAGYPYLIALDLEEMPSKNYQNIAEELLGYLPTWNHVSGIILFKSFNYPAPAKLVWDITLVTNPDADIPLPTELISYFNDEMQKTIEFPFLVSI